MAKIDEYSILLETGKYQCKICNKEFPKRGIAYHYWRSHSEAGREFKPFKSRVAWNKGLTKNTDARVKKNGDNIQKSVKEKVDNGSFKKTVMSEQARKELSIRQTLNNTGGRCKWYKVNGYKVQGTWERDLALHMTELGILWRKLAVGGDIIEYTVAGVTKRYTPDFELLDTKLLLETKGYWWNKGKEKMKVVFEQHPELLDCIKIILKDAYKRLLNSSNIQEFYNILYDIDVNSLLV
jgi:hypothetical protein